MNDELRIAIECSIARWWPDIDRIAEESGATKTQVHDVVDMLEALESKPRREHDCATHPAGSPACHDEHNCHCHDCLQAVKMRAKCFEINQARDVVLRAHAAHYRLSKAGVPKSEMPTWVTQGEKDYHAQRWVARKLRAS